MSKQDDELLEQRFKDPLEKKSEFLREYKTISY